MEDSISLHSSPLRARRGGSREAIVEAAEPLFMKNGFGAVSMDELADAAGVARRTLYNQFAGKEEIFREMLLRVSAQIEGALPPGIETRGDVGEVLRLIATEIARLHARPGYLGFFRMVVADSRQFPWIAQAFAAVMDPMMERFARYLGYLTELAILYCPNPMFAAHQFTGLLNENSLWPMLMGREGALASAEDVVEETVHMFLKRYQLPIRKHSALNARDRK